MICHKNNKPLLIVQVLGFEWFECLQTLQGLQGLQVNIVRVIPAIFLCSMESKPILCSNNELKLIQHVIQQLSRRKSKEVNAEILQILLDNPDFTRLHLSLYYPFTKDDLEKYHDRLIWGSIRYTTFVWDIKQEPIEVAEIGLSFNVNLFTLCSEEEFVIARQIWIEQEPNSTITSKLPLHLAGELEDRYATTIMAPYLQRPFLENFDPNQKAEDILVAYELYKAEGGIVGIEILKNLIERYGFLAAYSKVLWDNILSSSLDKETIDFIMNRI